MEKNTTTTIRCKSALTGKFLLILLLSTGAFAAENNSSELVETLSQKRSEAPILVADPWKATISSFYYDMVGTRSAVHPGAIYTFGGASLLMESFSLAYKLKPTAELSLTGSYMENYAVTILPTRTSTDRTVGFSDSTAMWTQTWPELSLDSGNFQFKTFLGEVLPTGDVAVKKPKAPAVDYAYFLQLGSGTFDTVAGISPVYTTPSFTAGSKFSALTRIGHNVMGYALGNLYRAEAWLDVPAGDGFTPRLTGLYRQKSSIRGADSTIPRQPYTEFYYHDQINWDISAALKYTYPINRATKLVAEMGAPLAQGMINYDRVVVATHYFGDVSINGSF